MAIVEWSDKFKIGEAEVDKEHWGLFALIHDLADKLALGAGAESLEKTINALVAYVNVHFEHEERLMLQIRYPDYASHKKAHEALTRRVAEFERALADGTDDFDFDGLMDFLSHWLSEHIAKLDTKFAAYHRRQLATA